jgi:hypothetical protein
MYVQDNQSQSQSAKHIDVITAIHKTINRLSTAVAMGIVRVRRSSHPENNQPVVTMGSVHVQKTSHQENKLTMGSVRIGKQSTGCCHGQHPRPENNQPASRLPWGKQSTGFYNGGHHRQGFAVVVWGNHCSGLGWA